jgi:Asp-tRNA(Asn)/Glu-tRNA(Gln) amidotransferase A subunit family amidase
VLSSGYYDAYYKKAQIVRTKLINEFGEAFKTVDFMVGPVAPTTAFKIGENADNPLAMYLQDVMSVPPSLAGLPAMSVPCGDVAGLPVGLQLIAPQKQGERLVSAQRDVSDNDGVWFGHKLRNRLVHENNVKLTERDVKDALIGIRGGLKDLGALK